MYEMASCSGGYAAWKTLRFGGKLQKMAAIDRVPFVNASGFVDM